MDITPPVAGDRQLIQGYGDGGFRVSGVRYSGSIIVFPWETVSWPVVAGDNFTVEHFCAIRDAGNEVSVLLLGCGAKTSLIGTELRLHVRDWGVVIEAMDTGAACRTYNVLLSEDRFVAAALIAIE